MQYALHFITSRTHRIMARIRPFKAFRPTEDKVHLVASRSYVTYAERELREKLENNPFSFIHIIHPDYNAERPSEPGTDERFMKVRLRFDDFVNEGILEQEQQPSLYLYRQFNASFDSVGIISAVDANDYRIGSIRVHEQTLAQREALFAEYLDATSFNAEPILLCHEDHPELNALYDGIMQRRPTYNFTTTDRYQHQLWQIDSGNEIAHIQRFFAEMKSLYIADGHHRSASSVLLADRRRLRCGHQEPLASDFFMALTIPASRLVIHGYHRLVRDLGGLSSEAFLMALKKRAKVVALSNREKLPAVGTIDLYLDKRWFRLDFQEQIHLELPDAEWLTREVLDPILKIRDLRNDPRVAFEPETTGVAEMTSMVDDGRFAAAFLLHPVPFDQLQKISDLGLTMPPKSTWIEPKLRSGLTIYEFSDDENVKHDKGL